MRRAVLLAMLWFMGCAVLARAEDVSRVPPKQYVDRLAALLTPADEALKHRTDKGGDDASASSLVTETARYVDDSGRSWLAVHQIDLARNDQGVDQIAKTVLPYRKSDQKVYLVLARSIQPDGSSNPVADNAVLVQTPQNDQDASLYSDQAELVIVFPHVKANTACESIIVIEDTKAEIPGEFTTDLQFSSNWYHWRRRNVLEMSKAMADRLTITPIGAVPATPTRDVLADGSVKLTWELDHLAAQDQEPDRAPNDQAGPVVYLTTMKSWETLAAWYRTLLKGRDVAGKDLAKQVADRTRGMTDPGAILATLLSDASRDVRYTGLEFGAAGLQPYDPNEVWANRYGDCKDKANLLRVMLRARQIPADLVLVNTEHAGRVEKRSPNIHQFDHMIVAVEKPGGGYVFCDPTVTYAKPGMLRPDDLDRDVLVLKDNAIEFVHTPAEAIGAVHYDFDLKLAADGSLTGWFSMNATGYIGASLAEYYSLKDKQTARSRAVDLVQSFYRSAQLIDFDAMPIEKYDAEYRLRAYFTVPADAARPGSQTFAFPGADAFLPDLEDHKSRQTDYWQARRVRTVHTRIQLPAGWTVSDVPLPLSLATTPLAATASWTSQRGVVSASLDYTTAEAIIPVDQYPLFYNAVTSLRSWLGKTVTVNVGAPGPGNVAATGPATQPVLADFPMLPTGDGQLDLIERKYPLDGDAAMRRLALQTVLQWFPGDRQTQFTANVRLLELDQRDRPKDPAIVEKMRRMIATAGDGLDSDSKNWAEYLLARWLTAADQKPEALAIFTHLAADAANPDARRGWASYRGAQLEESTDPKKAIALLESTLSLDTGILPTQFSELAPLLLQQGMASQLQADLESLAQRSPDDLDKVAAGLSDDAKDDAADEQKQQLASQLLDALEKLIAAHPPLGHLREQVDSTRSRLGNLGAYKAIVANLKKDLDAHRPAWWDGTRIDPALTTRDAFKAAIQRAHDAGPAQPFIRYTFEYLLRFPPDPDDFGERIWRLAAFLRSQETEPAILGQAFSLADQLPETDRWRWETALVRAYSLADHNDMTSALALLHQIGDNTKVESAIRYASYRVGGEYLERLARYDEALAMYKRLEPELGANNKNCDGLLRTIFLNLERDNRAEAMRVCHVLARVAEDDRNGSANAEQIRDLIALSNDPANLDRFWQRQATWWPQWLEIERRSGAPADDGPLVPLIPDSKSLAQQIAAAVQSGDREQFFRSYRVLVHAARWEPRFLDQWADNISQGIQIVPQQQTQWRELIVSALSGLDVPDAKVVTDGKFWLAAYLIDLNRSPEALQVIKGYLATATGNDSWRQSMHRLWSLATTDSVELGRALQAMQADLDSPDGVDDRPRTVTRMTDVYRQLGQRDLEVALLKRELNNPVIRADATHYQLLTRRYQSLSNVPEETAPSFDDGLAAWMSLHKPAWYGYAMPHTLKDLGQQDPIELLKNPPKRMLLAEIAKVGFLVAQDASRPKETRSWAFDVAVWQMTQLCRRHDQVAQLCTGIINDPRFPDHSRHYWLYTVLQDGADLPGIQMLRLNPLFESMDASDRERLDAEQLSGVDQNSPRDLVRYVDQSESSPLDPTKLAQFERAFNRLTQLSPGDSRHVYEQTQQLAVAPGTTETAAAVRMRLLRGLQFAEAYDPADRAAVGITLDHFAPMRLKLPEDWEEYRNFTNLELLDPKDALAMRLYALKTRRFDANDFVFWADITDESPRSMLDLSFRASLFETFLTQLPDDKSRSNVIDLCESFFDIDVPSHREQLLNLLAPYRDAMKYPYSAGMIRMVDAWLAIRDGKPVNMDDVMRDQKNVFAQMDEVQERLEVLLQQRDPAAIRRYFAQMDADTVSAPDELPRKLHAMRLAQMTDEADVIRQAAREQIYRDVLGAWSCPKRYQIREALKLAILLDDAGLIPAGWIDDCIAQIQNQELITDLHMRIAELRHDWSDAAIAADQLIAQRPTRYGLWWNKGNALFHLGKMREAVEALGTYVSHCKDEQEYADAVELLQKSGAQSRNLNGVQTMPSGQ